MKCHFLTYGQQTIQFNNDSIHEKERTVSKNELSKYI